MLPAAGEFRVQSIPEIECGKRRRGGAAPPFGRRKETGLEEEMSAGHWVARRGRSRVSPWRGE
jgi:hypothetical protein